MPTIEKTILGATKIKPPKPGEDRQKFLLRAMLGVQKLPADDWETLDQPIQDWYNAAVEADNADKVVPDFPDVEAEEAELEDEPDSSDDEDAPEEGEDEPEPEEEVVSKSAKSAKKSANSGAAAKPAKKASAKAPAKKPAAAPAAKKASAPVARKGTSMRRALKRMVVKKPSRTVEELIEALEKAGYKAPSRLTVATIRADTRDTIKVLNEAGITKIEITDGRAAA